MLFFLIDNEYYNYIHESENSHFDSQCDNHFLFWTIPFSPYWKSHIN